ncbi:replication factor A1 [Halopenitus malekzadehii]|uniref:Replication factor A1 n=1 Tax=Halopenitus malekzadehii TaxID=1267564 RepID=A0A1H6HTI7_9EURY|nr:single-stranded DNA binding protein [Halopenitus malekzadehii]SEH37465.1 replication factor A1 [Halopenitus malekzadehii]
MGVIEDVYEDLETDVEFDAFEAAVEDKVEQMGGLADEETAAMLIAHELRDEEAETIADIEPGMDEVKFLGKVTSIGEIRTFDRDDEDDDREEGRVCNVEIADESGSVRVALWDEMATGAAEKLEVGDVLRVMGRPKEGYNGLEVSANKVEPDADAAVDVQILDTYRVEDLTLGASDVTLVGKVLEAGGIRTFSRDDGSEGRVANLTLGDETGRVRVTMWDDRADLAEEFDAGEVVEVVDGYVRERDDALELHVGNRGSIERVDEDVDYVPETTPIADLEIGTTVDIAGGVIETDPKRTFDRDDGSEGQVRNVRIKDETGEIRVALWGEKADAEIDLADEVVVTDVEITDGWQDDLEASANWRSTVSVIDDGSTTDRSRDGSRGDGDSTEATGARSESESLGAFADGSSGTGTNGTDDGTAAGTGGATRAQSDGGAAAATADASGATEAGDSREVEESADDPVEFTGTVVQAGNPVVLDDGDRTKSVQTDETVRLGEEVTVRGPERDGRIDAEEVF